MMGVAFSPAFCAAMRHEAEKRRAGILVVGGQSGVGKSFLISRLLRFLDCQHIVVYDLASIRRRVLPCQPTAKKQLYDIFRCVGMSARESFSAELRECIYSSAEGLLKYYSWLEGACRSVILSDWQKQDSSKRLLILELVSPIDIVWRLADLNIHITPPAWRIERQLMKREGMTRLTAMTIRRLQEEAVRLSMSAGIPYMPNLTLSDSGDTEVFRVLHALRRIGDANGCIRTQ